MNASPTTSVSVPHLPTGARITYEGEDWIVQEVLAFRKPLSGWIVIAIDVQDRSVFPKREPLIFANSNATAELVHRALEGTTQ